MRLDNFTVYGANSYAPTAVAATSALPANYGGVTGSNGPDLLVQNVGTILVYCRFGNAGVTAATTNDTALQPGCAMAFYRGDGDIFCEPINTGQGWTHVSLICATAGTGNINIACGVGS